MKERLKKVTVVVKEKWTGFSTAIKVVLCCIPVALIAIIVILANLGRGGTTVLYSGLTTEDAAEIASVITNMGIKDVKMTQKGEVIVPSKQADDLRMKLSVQGYPRTTSDYSIWNDGVDLWSTETDKRVVAQHQREASIEATLRRMDAIRDAQALLSIPKTKDYVITEKEEVPSCSITIQLQDGEELTNAEVRAIFAVVSKAVDGLTYDNISVTDTKLRTYYWIDPADEAADEKDASGVAVGRRRLEFQRDMEMALKKDLDEFLTKIYGTNGYAINVAAILDFDMKRVVSTEYVPMDENGTGVLDHEDNVDTATNMNTPNGLTGTTPNAALSPDYPTYNGVADGQTYYYRKDEKQYDVTNIKTMIDRDGYKVESLTVGVSVNQTNMTEGERAMIENMVAKAAGTTVDNVAVANIPFYINNSANGGGLGNGSGGGLIVSPRDPNRNMLIILVIVLGVVLIGLIIASMMMSRSRKKKIRRRQEQALAAAQAAALDPNYGTERQELPQEVDFNIASLTEEAGKESRETILKREIAEFAQSSPEIVASIIRNMIREEGE